MKRAQELRVDEISLQKLRELWDNTKTHFLVPGNSGTDEFYERFRIISRSGIELWWKNAHVSSKLARIPSPRAMLSCDRRLPLDTWNRSGSQENVFANPRLTLESSQTTLSRNSSICDTKCSRWDLWQERKNESETQSQCWHFARRPPTMRSFSPVGIPQSCMVGQ